jgi:hypothetical protein
VPTTDGERLSGPPPVLRNATPMGAAAVLESMEKLGRSDDLR